MNFGSTHFFKGELALEGDAIHMHIFTFNTSFVNLYYLIISNSFESTIKNCDKYVKDKKQCMNNTTLFQIEHFVMGFGNLIKGRVVAVSITCFHAGNLCVLDTWTHRSPPENHS